MNRASRFRPSLEALEDRSLLSVSVAYNTNGSLVIDATQSNAAIQVEVFNDGAGNITGWVIGDGPAVPLNFSNVGLVNIHGGPGGTTVQYGQSGSEMYHNPAGGGFSLYTSFEGASNSFTAVFNSGLTLAQSVDLYVFGGAGNDKEYVNATGVNIGIGAQLGVGLYPTSDFGGTLNFSMQYSGVNRGRLNVYAPKGNYADETLDLDATFLGRGVHGTSPGDLSLSGGFAENHLTMLLNSSNAPSDGGPSVTGDLFGTGYAVNTCLRSSNVHSHNCSPDEVFHLVRFNPKLAFHPILP
jgi:hypothetical protein